MYAEPRARVPDLVIRTGISRFVVIWGIFAVTIAGVSIFGVCASYATSAIADFDLFALSCCAVVTVCAWSSRIEIKHGMLSFHPADSRRLWRARIEIPIARISGVTVDGVVMDIEEVDGLCHLTQVTPFDRTSLRRLLSILRSVDVDIEDRL